MRIGVKNNNMNILFIGPYRQNDEWGRKSRSVLKAIQKTNHNITSRPLYLSHEASYNQYTEKSEFNILDHYDILIQFLLQPYTAYNNSIAKKNIGIFNTETISNKIPFGQLTSELLMDEIWTDSPSIGNSIQKILTKYKPDSKVIISPPVLDTEDLPTQTNGSVRQDDVLRNSFIFYYTGNILEDKEAFKETCIAYLNTFTNKDSVVLLVLLERAINDENIKPIIDYCQKCVKQLNPIQHQPTIKIIQPQTGVLSTQERVAVHIDCDCMVCPSYPVCIKSTILEGILYKSTPIVNKRSACYEWFGEENLWGVESYEDLCISQNDSSIYRFTSGESWYKPTIKSLGEAMKNSYINKFERDKKMIANSKLRQYFEETSYNDVLNGESSWNVSS